MSSLLITLLCGIDGGRTGRHAGVAGNLRAAVIACGLAVLLLPFAWWRLAEIELP
jgi:hypothetical protein